MTRGSELKSRQTAEIRRSNTETTTLASARPDIELDTATSLRELRTPWFRKHLFLKAIAAGVAVPLVCFYVTDMALPLDEEPLIVEDSAATNAQWHLVDTRKRFALKEVNEIKSLEKDRTDVKSDLQVLAALYDSVLVREGPTQSERDGPGARLDWARLAGATQDSIIRHLLVALAEADKAIIRLAEEVWDERNPDALLKDVFFPTGSRAIIPSARARLEHNGRWLLENQDAVILIEGHVDERGKVEYNLAMGERRAMAAKDFLVSFGIESSRIETISYGESKPFALGHNEAAWALNRRAHFRIR